MRKEKPGSCSPWAKVWRMLLGMTGILLMTAAVSGAVLLYFGLRGHGAVKTQSAEFTESARQLVNPCRGFYHLYGFEITEEETDFAQAAAMKFCKDTETALALVQINLRSYREGSITDRGLSNLENLFEALERTDKQLIVRFLYDWDGECSKYEPERLEVILEHMEQLEEILKEHSESIFVLQGLFIGNWGEMNGSRYTDPESLRLLTEKLASVTGAETYLAVRTPAQWRAITGEVKAPSLPIIRLGVYNDGMLGNSSDYGTYGDGKTTFHGPYEYRSREEELVFLEELCRMVPLGGEVISDNAYNDFENAVRDLSKTHVSYLNRDYDEKVLEKWERTSVLQEGCFYGMDGLSYIERHLGYRLVLEEALLSYDEKKDRLEVRALIKNAGFAPMYRETKVRIVLVGPEEETVFSYEVQADLRTLKGGAEETMRLPVVREISLFGLEPGGYEVYLQMKDALTGEEIWLGNTADPEKYGYRLGSVEIGTVEELWRGLVE